MICTVYKASVPGLTLEQHATFRSDIAVQQAKMDEKLTVSECPDFEGQKCLIHHIKMPMLMSNRSIVQIYYTVENADGSLEFMSSSKGSDAVVAAQAGVIKKNVVGNNIVNYMKWTPNEGGCDVVGVNCLDIAGSIPDALKRKGAARQAKVG